MDISSLRERPSGSRMTVSELNNFIKVMFDTNRLLNAISVTGEISNFVRHRNGHLYFSLKDDGGQIRAVMFSSMASLLNFIPENGMRVIVRGSVTVYARDGSYQIYVKSIQPDGIGALYLSYERLKEKLSAEGLFDQERKKSIPEYPDRIGVITSPSGAAVRDVINILGRRYPKARVYIFPALVQGDGAVDTLIKGLDYFENSRLVDTVIIGRGGGSIEDLWAFNSEALARKISTMSIPVISAVGHETDFTICDFVADLRAPTPSAAAELAVPDVRELMLRIDVLSDRTDRAMERALQKKRERFDALAERGILSSPKALLSSRRERLEVLAEKLGDTYDRLMIKKRNELSVLVGKLESLNPLSVLGRGYSLAEKDGRCIRSASDIELGDRVKLRFSDGEAVAEIIG